MCSGPTPNFSFTPATSSTLPVMVLTSVIWPSTSCAMSLSPVEMTTGRSAAALLRARVPITSSASTPSTHKTDSPCLSRRRAADRPARAGHPAYWAGWPCSRCTVRPGTSRLGIEDDRERALRVLAPQAFEHVEDALDGAGRQPFGRGQGWQGMEGAVEVRRTVHQDERRLGHEQNQPFRRGRR